MSTITIVLGDEASAAYALLRSRNLDPDAIVEDSLIRSAELLQERAAQAAHLREDALQRTQLDELRDLPPQIEFLRPPR